MLSTESTNNLDWTSLQGTTLEGGYQLGDIMESDGRLATFRVRILGDYARKAFAKFYPAQAKVAQEQIALWERARALQHPNLCTPLGYGRVLVDGAEAIYVVLARADERLNRVIGERPLAPEEAREVLDVLVSALTYLHGQGLVHGCLSPEQVFAFGNSIKLSTMCARAIHTPGPIDLAPAKYIAPESQTANLTPAADVWCLGATLFEALTQRPYSPEKQGEVPQIQQPFAAVIQRCFRADPGTRPPLSELLKKEPPPPVTAVTPSKPIRSSVAEGDGHIGRARPDVAPQSHFSIRRSWIIAAIGLLVVALVIWAALPRHRTRTAIGPAAKTAKTAWPTQTLGDTATSEPARKTVVPAPKEESSANPANWRVILYTYAREQDAQQKAKALNEKHPGLDATVFSPSRGKLYLVVAGGPMTRAEAAKSRQKAMRMGMPRDSYIQNYK
jgi:hypothetical protein